MYIKAHDFLHSDNFYLREKIVKLLLGIYKQMKKEENLDAMNNMMDLFDEYVILHSFTVNDAIEKFHNFLSKVKIIRMQEVMRFYIHVAI